MTDAVDDSYWLYGRLEHWPSKAEMARLLETAGFAVAVGRFSIRLMDCEHFAFQEYGGDLGDPQIEAESSSLDRFREEASRISRALASAGIRHRFELLDEDEDLVGSYHHSWPEEFEQS